MSEFHVEIIRVGEVRPHPNAGHKDPALRCDNLSMARVHGSFRDCSGYPVLFRTGDFKEGDRAVYVPVDCVVPDTEQWHYLAPKGVQVGDVPVGDRRIKARRMRGVFSMGLLAAAPRGIEVGTDVAELMGITRWEPKDPSASMLHGDNVAGPNGWTFPQYTDIEPLRRHSWLLVDGERVIAREKVHGMNFRAVHDGERLWVGSHERVKRAGGDDPWSRAAIKYGLEERLAQFPMHVLYAEVYGKDETRGGVQIQDLTYGADDLRLIAFDVCRLAADTRDAKYLDNDEMVAFVESLGVPVAPALYDGPWSSDVLALCEGASVLGGGHVREGFVVRPERERRDGRAGRVILKMVGEGYHMRPAGKHASADDKAKRAAVKEARRAEHAARRHATLEGEAVEHNKASITAAVDEEILEALRT